MSAHREFKSCRMRYGDKLVGAVEVRCQCGATAQRARGLAKYSTHPKDDARRFQQQFEHMGWSIGGRPQDDRCPKCVRANKAHRAEQRSAVKEKPTMPSIAPSAVPPPRDMPPADGRIIMAKLDDVYDTNGHGYTSNWTDQRVATDLGVPRAWVEGVRKQFFGPEGGNPEIAKQVAEAQAYLTEAKSLAQRFGNAKSTLETLIAETHKLNARGEQIERRLADIQKAVRP